MFTGIIEELGTVKSVRKGAASAVIEIAAPGVVDGLATGESVCVNGVCLTAVSISGGSFCADVMAETLRATNLGGLSSGDKVNLERALRLSDRLGGHIVTGHVDGVGGIKSAVKEGIATVFTISAPPAIMRYIIDKGSIAVDGISLTVVDFGADSFRVSIIPHTANVTTLGFKGPGDGVNLEPDMLAKYIERLMQGAKGAGGLDTEFLKGHGFM